MAINVHMIPYFKHNQLTKLGIGHIICVWIKGDPINETKYIDVLSAFLADPDTEKIVMAGEIGEVSEETSRL